MLENQWLDLFKTLGVAFPLVALLFWLLRENVNERKQVTSEFLSTLRETVKAGSDVTLKAASSMDSLSSVLREGQQRSSIEHQGILEALLTSRNFIEKPKERT